MKYRDTVKTLQKKGQDGQMAKKASDETSFHFENSMSCNDSHRTKTYSNSLLVDMRPYKDVQQKKEKEKTKKYRAVTMADKENVEVRRSSSSTNSLNTIMEDAPRKPCEHQVQPEELSLATFFREKYPSHGQLNQHLR